MEIFNCDEGRQAGFAGYMTGAYGVTRHPSWACQDGTPVELPDEHPVRILAVRWGEQYPNVKIWYVAAKRRWEAIADGMIRDILE